MNWHLLCANPALYHWTASLTAVLPRATSSWSSHFSGLLSHPTPPQVSLTLSLSSVISCLHFPIWSCWVSFPYFPTSPSSRPLLWPGKEQAWQEDCVFPQQHPRRQRWWVLPRGERKQTGPVRKELHGSLGACRDSRGLGTCLQNPPLVA